MAPQRTRSARSLVAIAVVIAIGWIAQQAGIDLSAPGSSGSATRSAQSSSAASLPPVSAPAPSEAVARIRRAADARESGFMVTVDARVIKLLPDDRDGSRHQRFLIELEDRRTLLIAHNIDLAERVPLEEQDRVRIRGQYEWNERGGLLHWTHHDPDRRHPGGWIEHEGQRVE